MNISNAVLKRFKTTCETDSGAEFPLPTCIQPEDRRAPVFETPAQFKIRSLIGEMAEKAAARQGMTRRRFLRTSCGLALSFMAMNEVYGPVFEVNAAEVKDWEAARERSSKFAEQFIFDVQLHFVKEDFPSKGILSLRDMARQWNPELKSETLSIQAVKFRNFLKEIFVESETTIGLLSNAPSDRPKEWFLTNEDAIEARRIVNELAGSKRLLCHTVITPGQPGWLEKMDRAIEVLKPDSWKGYTAGSPSGDSKYPWRLDDEKLMYPAYDKMLRSGIRNICIHKGLLPSNYRKVVPKTWEFANVDDVAKAAREWPQLNFIIYHSALDTIPAGQKDYFAEFEKTGRIAWVSDLAEISSSLGLQNVYAEIGSTFATSCIAHPKFCAAILGTLIKGLGADHVVWGTDSVWYGSPQWQIEAMRRIEMPEEMQTKYGFAPLGPADGRIKAAILGGNSAKMYGLKPTTIKSSAGQDRFARLRAEYLNEMEG